MKTCLCIFLRQNIIFKYNFRHTENCIFFGNLYHFFWHLWFKFRTKIFFQRKYLNVLFMVLNFRTHLERKSKTNPKTQIIFTIFLSAGNFFIRKCGIFWNYRYIIFYQNIKYIQHTFRLIECNIPKILNVKSLKFPTYFNYNN